MLLLHGTTLSRAQSIIQHGPDPSYLEPSGYRSVDGFTCSVAGGPSPLLTPQDYAAGKAVNFPLEGGPIIPVVSP
jgi:hypothetical protein